jgi:hypothetical protein
MTTFKEIRGTAIESVSSDPSNPEVGQIWYNNTIGVLKGYTFTAAAWAEWWKSFQLLEGFGIAGAGLQTAAFGAGGIYPVELLQVLQKNIMVHLGQLGEIWVMQGILVEVLVHKQLV